MGQPQSEKMHQGQMSAGIDEIVGSIIETVRLATPEQGEIPLGKACLMPGHPVVRPAAHDVVDLDLGMPMGPPA